jgi:hypothetical protein
MRQPQLYDFVYLNKYGQNLFQVIGVNHSLIEKYPTYEVMNVATLRDVDILCPLPCKIEELYGAPLGDIEFHFPEGENWDWVGEEIEGEDSQVNFLNCYDFNIKNGRWIPDFSGCDPEPTDIEYLHELQQYHRGVWGYELDVFGTFVPINLGGN